MEDDLDIVDELESAIPAKRSNFLTVLCILTWVGSGLWIIWGMFALPLVLKTDFGWIRLLTILKVVMPLFCIAGSVLMWFLKKWGFVLYVIGELTPALLVIYLSIVFGESSVEFSLVLSVISSAIPIGFVVMYALQLKDMHWKTPSHT